MELHHRLLDLQSHHLDQSKEMSRWMATREVGVSMGRTDLYSASSALVTTYVKAQTLCCTTLTLQNRSMEAHMVLE
jgi:hypothetical protein